MVNVETPAALARSRWLRNFRSRNSRSDGILPHVYTPRRILGGSSPIGLQHIDRYCSYFGLTLDRWASKIVIGMNSAICSTLLWLDRHRAPVRNRPSAGGKVRARLADIFCER